MVQLVTAIIKPFKLEEVKEALRGAGILEWPLRILLVIGGFVIATPGGGINPLSQAQIMSLGFAILAPTVLIALFLIRRQSLVSSQLRAP